MGSVSDESARLARAREVFLSSGEEELEAAAVREPILNSWRRSRFWGVAVDQQDLPYREDLGSETGSRLVLAAAPVLDRIEQEMADARMSVILTDAQAWVLDRRAGERSLNAYLDRVLLAPGFSYSEKFIGTNGIGTALEEKRPSHVFGHEHFVERLQSLSCAGAPIRDPLSGRVVGLIDVTCWRADATLLMSALVRQAARDIEGRLFEQSCERERALLQEFLAACRRTRRPVLSLSDDLVITNARATRLLDPDDHVIVREQALALASAATSGSERETVGEVLLSGGQLARLRCRPVTAGSGVAGTIVEIQVAQADAAGDGSRRRTAGAARGTPPPPPGLAGHSPAWLRVCEQADAHCRERSRLLLVGEPGVGKATLASAVHRRAFPAGRLTVIDTGESGSGEAWVAAVAAALAEAGGGDTVLLRRLDQLGVQAARALTRLLDEQSAGSAPADQARPWVVGTLATATIEGHHLEALLRHFAAVVTVPPLRHRIGDVRELVPVLLQRLAPRSAVGCSPEVMQTFLRRDWPGNVRELEQVLRAALARRRGGQIELADLPEDVHATSRHVLTTWESLERDAIIRALVEAGGNRAEAAARLGISRATIYRKIHAYGIVVDGPDRDAKSPPQISR
jgi:transcriptional regulator of acetoin/glycerol metabolism